MFKLHCLLAWRNLSKRRFYNFLKISGLATGLTCFLIVALYIRQELSYESFFTQKDNIYRINHIESGSGNRYSGIPSALATHIKAEIPSVKQVVKVFFPYQMFSNSALVQYKDVRFYEDKIIYADSTFFQLFDFPMIEGNPLTALKSANSIVLSEKAAQRYFGKQRAVGKLLAINQGKSLEVTAVVKVPENTHLQFDFLQATHAEPSLENVWLRTISFQYLLIEKKQHLPNIEKQLYQIVLANLRNHSIDFLKNYHHKLQPLSEIHTSILNWDIVPAVSPNQLYAFGGIAVFILLLAIINFVNLATAHASERNKEVGMSKILGANTKQLIIQYLAEAILITGFAGILSLLLLELSLPIFNQLAQTNLTSIELFNPLIFSGFLLVLLLVGVLAGIYPAIVLAKFQPVQVIKKTNRSIWGQKRLRESLVVIQFVISIALLVSTLIVQQQIHFMQTADLGFNKSQIMIIRMREANQNAYKRLKNNILRNSKILKVAGASNPIGSPTGTDVFTTHLMPRETPNNFSDVMQVDYDFLDLMKIPLLQGRNFSPQLGRDFRESYILNESAVKQYQFKNPIGEPITRSNQTPSKVIGVIKDFHYNSLIKKISPLILDLDSTGSYRYTFVKLASQNIAQSLDFVKAEWDKLYPKYPIEYFFQDEHFNRQYQQQEQIRRIVGYFATLAIFLACLGLVGLSSFTVLQKTKEIGIRKVLGATIQQILFLLSYDFIKMIGISLLIACPLAYWLMNQWLADFSYRVEIGWLNFILVGISVLLLTILTIAYQAIRASLANPVEALKYE